MAENRKRIPHLIAIGKAKQEEDPEKIQQEVKVYVTYLAYIGVTADEYYRETF